MQNPSLDSELRQRLNPHQIEQLTCQLLQEEAYKSITERLDKLTQQLRAVHAENLTLIKENLSIGVRLEALETQRDKIKAILPAWVDDRINARAKRQDTEAIGQYSELKEQLHALEERLREQLGTLEFRLDEIEELAQRAGAAPKRIARFVQDAQLFFAELNTLTNSAEPAQIHGQEGPWILPDTGLDEGDEPTDEFFDFEG
jgi:chromosome segregation ATPase